MGSMHCNCDLSLPLPMNEVVLHIYNLRHFKRIRFANALLQPLGTGAYHVAVEVIGIEFSYGCKDEGTGVFERLPACDDKHHYREAVRMGHTNLSMDQVRALVEKLKVEWQGDDYDMLRHNCQHFAVAFCRELGVGELPAWITRLPPALACLSDVKHEGKEKGKKAALCVRHAVRSTVKASQVQLAARLGGA